MTIENLETVDAIGAEKKNQEVVLLISDHLDWADPDRHLKLLQEKINTYLRFIESGEMVETYPPARDRAPVIKVVGAHALAKEGIAFFEEALPILRAAGVELRFAMLPEDRS
jgi:hypothetical protein